MQPRHNTITRNELVAELALDADVSLQTASNVLDAFERRIVKHVKNEECVQFRGFGTYGATHYNVRSGINPRTGESWEIASHDVLHFKPSKALTRVLNQCRKSKI